ncbi:hypothetical protein JAAARDRAFT_201735 [Jaapia argillacea MUCL 33604]|uniref:Enoyl reductase (ER) domain-containing protein n=1 Tax=Jaapia argillacea MUCL 33604 TaxID=933084 RepID=A0A067QLJ6_9AGAM|nr:hypothetical protein JAAARDRAFT_201735 [Jaapia argillacea MUCL 33604]
MSPVKNGRHLFNEIPTGFPEPGKTTVYDGSQTIDPESVALSPGSFLLKTLVLSIDPYMRGKMRAPSAKSHSPPYTLGEVLYNFGVGIVIRSENEAVKPGDHLYGMHTFEEYSIKDDASAYRVLKNEEKLPWSVYLGAGGMPGQTAFFGWKEYSKAKEGETVFVTAGAGGVGSLVIQIAKSQGLKVIASAGSEEKVKFLKELGADVAFNYKTTSTRDILQKGGPINVFWDNVGGETLEAALDAAALGARFIECGMMSGHDYKPYGVKNLANIVSKAIAMTGFLVFRFFDRLDEFYAEIPAKLASGKLVYREDITRGLENVGEAIHAVETGRNKAKSVILVADEKA